MKRVLMDGYVTEHSEKRTVNNEEVEIVMYQGEHCDEYLGVCWNTCGGCDEEAELVWP